MADQRQLFREPQPSVVFSGRGVHPRIRAAEGSMNDWFLTASGRRLHVLTPDPEWVHIDDIAHALSHLCRFGGHSREFYSVAQHCVLVSELVPPDHALLGLMHDATEAYLGDIIRPVKALLKEYSDLETLWRIAIADRFGLPRDLPSCIKDADLTALVTERRDLIRADGDPWREDKLGYKPDPRRIVPMDPRAARRAFLGRFDELTKPTWPR